jgi:hypothetical protein
MNENQPKQIVKEIALRYLERYGLVIRRGPFAGMLYVTESGSRLLPKLIGCYEEELHSVLNDPILKTRYEQVINVGCGEGYYAVGLARRMPQVAVHAFDSNTVAQQLCKQLAVLNKVNNRITIGGKCDAEQLVRLTNYSNKRRTLIVCDVEGYEINLLKPELVPGLQYCDILVELHDFVKRDLQIPKTVMSRFADTHVITHIPGTVRNPKNYSELEFLNAEEQQHAVSENRPELMEWAFMRSRNRK